MSRTTVYAACMTCNAKTPPESDDVGGGLASKQVELWKQANGWRNLPTVEGRRQNPVVICAACIADVVSLTARLPTLEEQS